MTSHTYANIASIATLAAFTVIGPVCAGGDKVAFPENHEAGVLFTTDDRPDNKQFREFYTSAAALAAAKKGEPLPDGTVITMLQYAAKLDAQGNQRSLHQRRPHGLCGDGEAYGLGQRVS